MNDASTMKRSAKRNTTDWTQFDALTDVEIHKAALTDPDAQPLTRRQLARMKRITMKGGRTKGVARPWKRGV